MLEQRELFKIKNWAAYRVKDRISGYNAIPFKTEMIVFCSGRDNREAASLDIQKMKKKYPDSDLEGYNVVDLIP